jgi:hypothetical protein
MVIDTENSNAGLLAHLVCDILRPECAPKISFHSSRCACNHRHLISGPNDEFCRSFVGACRHFGSDTALSAVAVRQTSREVSRFSVGFDWRPNCVRPTWMQPIQPTSRPDSDLNWLAFLLTGDTAAVVDAVRETVHLDDAGSRFFAGWMRSWFRRVVISRALATVRDALFASARRTESRRIGKSARLPRNWRPDANTSLVQLERALRAIDLFPRCALVLSTFEGLSVEDASILLDCVPDLVRKGQAIAAQELTANLARMRNVPSGLAVSRVLRSAAQHV